MLLKVVCERKKCPQREDAIFFVFLFPVQWNVNIMARTILLYLKGEDADRGYESDKKVPSFLMISESAYC